MKGSIHHSVTTLGEIRMEKKIREETRETVNTYTGKIITIEKCRRAQNILSTIHRISETVNSLDESLTFSRNLEAEQWLRYSSLKAQKVAVIDDLRKANKQNKNMLNLFRQSVTDTRIGNTDTLPESLKREVQRTWHRKYDDLLKQNELLKKEIVAANAVIEEKNKQIDILERRLLNISENIIEREEAVKSISIKYLSLKKRKEEEEVLLRGSIQTLQDALQKARDTTVLSKPQMRLALGKDAQLAREIQRGDRLTYENALLRAHLLEARRACRSNASSSTVSFQRD